jgi:hypothetical protein
MPAGSQIVRGLLINLKPDELFYSFTQAVDVLEKKDPKSIFYAKLLKDASQSYQPEDPSHTWHPSHTGL